MKIDAIDHVNIVTDDLDGTADFFEQLLGLRRGDSPGAAMGLRGAWMYDASDNPIVHLGWNDPARDFGGDHVPGAVTGAIHHIAFRCRGFDTAVERLEKMGVEYRVGTFPNVSFRQILLRDPNNINLELNFSGD